MNDGDTVVCDVFHLVGVPVFTSEQWKTLSMWDSSVVSSAVECLAPLPTELRVHAVELVSLQPGWCGRRNMSSSPLGSS